MTTWRRSTQTSTGMRRKRRSSCPQSQKRSRSRNPRKRSASQVTSQIRGKSRSFLVARRLLKNMHLIRIVPNMQANRVETAMPSSATTRRRGAATAAFCQGPRERASSVSLDPIQDQIFPPIPLPLLSSKISSQEFVEMVSLPFILLQQYLTLHCLHSSQFDGTTFIQTSAQFCTIKFL